MKPGHPLAKVDQASLAPVLDGGVTYLRSPHYAHGPLHVPHRRYAHLTACCRPRQKFAPAARVERFDSLCRFCAERIASRRTAA